MFWDKRVFLESTYHFLLFPFHVWCSFVCLCIFLSSQKFYSATQNRSSREVIDKCRGACCWLRGIEYRMVLIFQSLPTQISSEALKASVCLQRLWASPEDVACLVYRSEQSVCRKEVAVLYWGLRGREGIRLGLITSFSFSLLSGLCVHSAGNSKSGVCQGRLVQFNSSLIDFSNSDFFLIAIWWWFYYSRLMQLGSLLHIFLILTLMKNSSISIFVALLLFRIQYTKRGAL